MNPHQPPTSPVKRKRAHLYVDGKAPKPQRVPVTLRLLLGLLLLIFAGTLLLLLPGVAVNGRLTFMQAIFTATSALTVTGLSTIVAATDLTRLGQVLLLLLIQLGGVGYMFAATLTLRLLGQRISLMDRIALSQSLGLNRPMEVRLLLKRVFYGILLMEGIGTLLLFIFWQLNGTAPANDVFFYALFHAVSAFCNAGFDLFAGLPAYPSGLPDDTPSLIIMGTLIIMGGLGIPVLTELFNGRSRQRFSLHTRVTLGMVVMLTLFGWGALLLAETRPGGVLENAPLEEQLVHTWFQSVSTRTAGFPGLSDFNNLAAETELTIMVLMFIGSAPASMGGGITTGTFAVLLLGVWGYARGLPQPQLGKRTISGDTVRRGSVILSVSVGVVLLATWLLLLTHEFQLDEALFEVISAFATCGLSIGATGSLNVFGQWVIMLVMFWGRLGALTIVLAIAQRGSGRSARVRFPEEPFLIG